MNSREVRQQFLDFFADHDHTIVPSTPVVPVDDPTLMFTNAGMNQFKDVFLATGSRPYKRAADTQKCIRVSGKHNDLEEVGRDTYHHTFFEMLGNWSFGDYFKAEAIEWGWKLLTDVYGLPKDRLYATVFAGDPADGLEPDDEAFRLWAEVTDIDPSHISKCGKKDNFWEMGETGPCGPCSEIHIDLTPDGSGAKLVNTGRPEVIELWNLVFIQFNRDASGKLHELPAKHVDTGLGFERLCAVLQGKSSNYDTDVFTPLLGHLEELTGKKYVGSLDSTVDVAFRVIADHVRMLTFAMADNAKPGNEGRGYVLRRILRRASRFGRQCLEQRQPFIHKLVPTLVDTMDHVFPELKQASDRVQRTIRDEEESFGRTLERGIQLFVSAADRAGEVGSKQVAGEDAFKLYDTYGFPLDLTVQMADERGLSVDTGQFDALMHEAKAKARAAAKKHAELAFDGHLPTTDDSPKYDGRDCQAKVLGWVKGHSFDSSGSLTADDGEVGLVLDRTSFYAEQGGQVGDGGTISTNGGDFVVDDTVKLGDGLVHIGHVSDGTINVGEAAAARVDAERDDTRRNHTATHLLHWALGAVLGEDVAQQGSLVDSEKLRFDFDHHRAVTSDELAEIERRVNEQIYRNLPVTTRTLPTEEARQLAGVRAFFGEKYGDSVRVVEIGDGFSREFCGGTHLESTGQAGPFKIVSEEAVSKGVRRITAVTGPAAVRRIQALEDCLRRACESIRSSPDQLVDRIAALQNEAKDLRKQVTKGVAADVKSLRAELLQQASKVGDHVIIASQVPEIPVQQMREMIDWFRAECPSVAVFLAARQGDKALLLASVSDNLVEAGLSAGELIKQVAPLVGGGGGGKPQLAQAGGKNVEAIPQAVELAKKVLLERLQPPA